MLEGKPLDNFKATKDRVSELVIEDIKIGDGVEVMAGQTVTAHYTGAQVDDGVVFQSSLDTGSPFTASLNQLIKGWQVGIPGMKVGGKRRLTIPADQAYGEVSHGGRPAGDLVFDIEILAVI